MNFRGIISSFPTSGRNFFLDLLKESTKIHHLQQIHAQIIANGYKNDISTVTKLTHRLCDLGRINYARDLFLSIRNPDIFLFNVVIKGYSSNGSSFSSISLFNHLRRMTTLRPDNYTYSFAVAASSDFRSEKVGNLLHGQAVVDGLESDLFVGSSLVDLYFKFSKVDLAKKMFNRMLERDTVLWNTVISGLVKNCRYEESIGVFIDMIADESTRLDSTSVTAVLPAPAELQMLGVGMSVHSLALKLGLDDHEYVITGLMSTYSKCGEIESAGSLFGQIARPDLISYNAMISGYTCNGETENSVRLFRELLESGDRVNSSTIVGLIPVFQPFGHLDLTSSIYGFCIKSSIVSNPAVMTALTTVYSRLSEMELARKIFDESNEKCLESWNAMISGYAQIGLTKEAISLFKVMQESEVRPNPVTITSVLSACAQLGALSLGKWVHELIKREEFDANIFVMTALIDMYAKCGSIAEARHLFDLMPDKNVVTWNSMISGYGLHGHGNEAWNLYNQMLQCGIFPSRVTFLSVLHACSHAGMVAEGERVFHSMIIDHGFEPIAEHYACMVDMFGRSGQLRRALDFIERMPTEPGPAMWGALLGACMIHKDTTLAHLASERLFALDPENVGYYVLLSNIYSVDKKFPLAASIRQVVKRKSLVKIPGCTLIEIGEVSHMFTSGDRSHPQSDKIYMMLEKLVGKMKEAGYKPETTAALHDIEDEEKEMMFEVHSEKLAIAFGLIATEPGADIRIIKNLRVCLDCHTATKFISKITERLIVVRDANRFHHFKDGVCSCGDYW
ncbi:hypothetical protein MLD38_014491 [Melastoma candidum]|uniref:Uncharacterized protein n=1 Tax=Melastoma candidum TaxID=119954 RepID=A0ACB9RCX4_9MYRT|nr:hypothetical protein MLD38_014491 [Melastoma candidum]